MKLEVLVINEESLKTLANTKFSNAQLTWDLSESFDEVEKILTKFQKKREELVKEHGMPDPDSPENFIIPDIALFQNEMQKILEVEVDMAFPTFSLSELKNTEISINDMRSWKALGIITME